MRDLLEREAPIAALDAALARACGDAGSAHVVVGPAGIGKTVVLDVVRRRAEARGARLLSARASDLDRDFGFGIVHQLLEATVRDASPDLRARLFAGSAGRAEALFGGPPNGGDVEYSVLGGLYWLVANLAEERPLVLCVDDLHWADVASLRWLEFLVRRIDDLPVLLVATCRPREPGAPAALLSAIGDTAAEIRLEPLSDAAASVVLGAALGCRPEAGFAAAAREVAGGNPLLLTVLGREARLAGLRGRDAERERLPALGGRGLAPTVVRRLGTLGVTAAAVARAVAVLGSEALVGDVAALAGCDVATVRRPLAELADAGILQAGGGVYAHPLIGEAVRASIPHPERERLHRAAAHRLRERGAPPAAVAVHRIAVGPAGDPMVVRDLRAAAAVAAAEGATETAIDLLQRAVAEQAEGPDASALLLELAELELRLLRPEGRDRARAALAGGLRGTDAARVRAALGSVLLLSDPEAALAEIDAARAEATDPGVRLRLEATALEALVFVDALAAERDARFTAIRASSAPSVVELALLASGEALAGRPADEVAALGARALAGDVLLDQVGPAGSTWNLLGHAFRFAERPEPARRVLAAGDRVVRERGLRAAGVFVDQAWAYWHRDFGSVARGLAHAEAGYHAIGDAGLPISRAAVAAVVAENLVLLDRAPEAAALMDQPLGSAEQTFVEVFAVAARGLTRMRTGRIDEAEHDLRRVVEILDARGWHAPWAALGRIRLAELLVAEGREDEARPLVEHDVAVADAAGTRGALGVALRIRASTEPRERGLETLRRAERSLAGSPLLLEHGRALLALGAGLRQAGDRAAARDALRHALDRSSRAESAWLERLVRDELRAAGARPRRARTSGVAALTARERRIAELAAEGLTNREIAEALWVTRKTVEYHLSRVYAKLDVPSRAGLARALGASPHADRSAPRMGSGGA